MLVRSATGLFIACLLATAIARSDAPLDGIFALQGGAAKANAYLIAKPIERVPLARSLDLWLTPVGSDVVIRSFDVDMTKLLHAVIISDDFRTFLHEHPQLEPSGHFTLDQTLPHPGLYHIYADTEPQNLGQQVFRFDVPIGEASDTSAGRDLSERSTTFRVDGYDVELSSLHLHAGGESMIAVHILHAGKPAADLHPYLGALGHAVFINAADLSYVHVHPQPLGASGATMAPMPGMGAMSVTSPAPATLESPASMAMHVRVLEPGTYKLWLQFAGGTGLHVAEFVLTAS